uniref:Receptor ligand binding region domain-containing protein n=1 Tax=Tetranychus urticae TaxID=32264 RepID=T1KYH0_TETUR
MEKSNLTVGAFSVFGQGFVEVDGQTVPELKSLKRFAAIMADYGPFKYDVFTLNNPKSGQLGVLTETGYHDGVLGLMQEGKVELCFLPMALDTQKVPGQFTPVISEESYYISSMRILGGVNTLRDVIKYGKIPFFIEGISMYDLFKAKVTKEYAEIYERAKSKGFAKPYELGPFPVIGSYISMVTFISTLGVKVAPLGASEILEPNKVQYISDRPFHRSVQALLMSSKTPKSIRRRVHLM